MSSLNLDHTRYNTEVSHGPVPRRDLRLVGPQRHLRADLRPGDQSRHAGDLGVGPRLLLWYLGSLLCLAGLIAGAAWLEGYW